MTRNELLNAVDSIVKEIRRFEPHHSAIPRLIGMKARPVAEVESTVTHWLQFLQLAPGLRFVQMPSAEGCRCGETTMFFISFGGLMDYGYEVCCRRCGEHHVVLHEPRPMPSACDHPRITVSGCEGRICSACGVPWERRPRAFEEPEFLVPDRLEGWLAAAV